MDYIKEVIPGVGLPSAVVLHWAGKTMTVKKCGKDIDFDRKRQIPTSREIKNEMLLQARAILFGTKEKTKKKSHLISTRNLSPEKRNRVEILKELTRAEIRTDGSLVITRKSGEKFLYTSLDKAISAHREIIVSLDRESELLVSAIDILEKNREAISAPNHEDFDVDVLDSVFELLENSTDEFKTRAADELNMLIQNIQENGFINEAEAVVSLNCAIHGLQSRIEAITIIVSAIKKKLEVFIREEANILDQISLAVKKLNPILNSDDSVINDKTALNEELDKIEGILEGVWLEPHFKKAMLSRSYIAKAKRSASGEERRRHLIHAIWLLKKMLNDRKENPV